ncbi:DNA cytosine methyltransferase [Exiguobacterium sp. s102]|uniref:DNA cytosine methyltransferase n=1 Tax=Exiguobacterium sp. s102 TaxID=2751212 RepID=UPI001BE67C96|nr:DNA cytosine methyltransferase [Exiguobacterium sp. s102]
MKINERGRGKFRPLKSYENSDVKNILFEKIYEETNLIIENNEEETFFNTIKRSTTSHSVISLFSGAGGLDLGLELASLVSLHGEDVVQKAFHSKEKFKQLIAKGTVTETIYSNDIFKESAITYKTNFSNHVIQDERDIRKIKYFPDCDLILGGFPCPGFSSAGPRLIDDERNFLYIHFIRAIIQTRPKVFVAENVKGLLTLGNGEVAKQIIEDFASAGYSIKYQLVNARDYGVPQLRERVFIVGVREGIDFDYEFPEPTHGPSRQHEYVTLADAISDLHPNPSDVYSGGFSSMYLSRNRKKEWADQAFTIQASGRQAQLWPGGDRMMKIGKDEWKLVGENRRMSVRESARIQTFPDWWEFYDGGNMSTQLNNRLDKQYKQIGNAVPVLLALRILQPITDWLKNEDIVKTKSNKQLELF